MLVINQLMSNNYKLAVQQLKQEFNEVQYETVETFINNQFHTNNIAYTSSSDFAAFWYMGNHNTDWKKELFIIKDKATSTPKKLKGLALSINNELIAYYEDENENDYFYYVEIVKAGKSKVKVTF